MSLESMHRPASKMNKAPDNTIEMEPQFLNFSYEKFGDIFSEEESRARESFKRAAVSLEKEWNISSPINVPVQLMSDGKFREGARPTDPMSWKYCFILRDQPDDKIYLDTNIFSVLPDDAEAMIKHETAHIVVEHCVGDISAYRKSFFLEEGTAGLDGATDRFIAKLKIGENQTIPDPLSFQTIEKIKSFGGDTNQEPFTKQMGYLVLFSVMQFLRQRHSETKIVEWYKNMGKDISLEDAYQMACGEKLDQTISDWRDSIKLGMNENQ